MAFEKIPLDSSTPYFDYKIDMGDLFYTFSFAYNSIMDRWSISIYTEDETPILLGIPLLVNRPIINTTFDHIEALFDGEIFVINYADPTTEPGFEGFDDDCDLIYSDEALV